MSSRCPKKSSYVEENPFGTPYIYELSFNIFINYNCRSKSGQQYYLDGLELIISRHEIYLDLLPKILQNLNQELEVLSDGNILAWNRKMATASKTDPLKAKIVAKLKPFIEWLEQSDSESDSE